MVLESRSPAFARISEWMDEGTSEPTLEQGEARYALEARRRTPDPILLTIPDAARMLALGRTTVYELIGSGALEVVHVGRAVRVPVAALQSFVERKRTGL
jgi:excisionase family DNA binding protein